MKNMAIAYSMKNRKKMAAGGQLDSGYLDLPKNDVKGNSSAMGEDDKDLNQMGEEDTGPMGAYALGGDIVDHIMKKRQMYSEGGKVANATPITAGFKPNEFDDLVLRDDLESSSDGVNNGDYLGNAQQDEDRADIVSRIMRQRSMKQRNPRPA